MNLKQDLFTLLYSHATNLFQQRTYSSASQFFHAAHLYAEEGNKAKTARIMAVCSIATKSLDRCGVLFEKDAVITLASAFLLHPFRVMHAALLLRLDLLLKQ